MTKKNFVSPKITIFELLQDDVLTISNNNDTTQYDKDFVVDDGYDLGGLVK